MKKERHIYLLRHGEIARPNKKMLIGQHDLPLTSKGIVQMERAAHFLAAQQPIDTRIGKLITSPQARCTEGGRIIGAQLGITPEICNDFREIDLGHWDGLTKEEIERKFPGGWQARGEDLARYRPAGGESFADLAQRVIPAFTRLTENLQRDIAIIAHAGVNRVILAFLLQMPLENIFTLTQSYGCINILQQKEEKRSLALCNFLPG